MILKKFFSLIFVFFIFAGAGIQPQEPRDSNSDSPASAQSGWSSGWYENAEGYALAVAEYEKTNKPMAVYFEVEWCPYCRQFEKSVLANPGVAALMKDMIKVRVNPETSARANVIAFQYGIMGYPSFYVHPPKPGGTVRLYTGVSPQQFIDLFQKAIE